MESLDELFLMFKESGFYYLIPLSQVERIQDRNQCEDQPLLEFSEILDAEDETERMDRYVIFFTGVETGLLVETVEGLIHLLEESEYPLEEPVLHEGNRYLRAVACVETKTGPAWAYVLDSKRLTEAPEPPGISETDMEQEYQMEASDIEPEELQGGEYLTLTKGHKTVYIDKEQVVAVVVRPKIQMIPGAKKPVIGFSIYKKNLIIYYDQFGNQNTDRQSEQQKEYACGVIFRTKKGSLAAVAGDMTGEGTDVREQAEYLSLLGNGIWEKKCD